MIVQNNEELQKLRHIGGIVARCLEHMIKCARAGMSLKELDQIAAQFLAASGARSAPILMYEFPGHTCLSLAPVAALPGRDPDRTRATPDPSSNSFAPGRRGRRKPSAHRAGGHFPSREDHGPNSGPAQIAGIRGGIRCHKIRNDCLCRGLRANTRFVIKVLPPRSLVIAHAGRRAPMRGPPGLHVRPVRARCPCRQPAVR